MKDFNTTDYNTVNTTSKRCRYCKDSQNTNDLIAPCDCTADNKYIHRKCLDHLRQCISLTTCTKCNRDYDIIIITDYTLIDKANRKVKLLIFRDIIKRHNIYIMKVKYII